MMSQPIPARIHEIHRKMSIEFGQLGEALGKEDVVSAMRITHLLNNLGAEIREELNDHWIDLHQADIP